GRRAQGTGGARPRPVASGPGVSGGPPGGPLPPNLGWGEDTRARPRLSRRAGAGFLRRGEGAARRSGRVLVGEPLRAELVEGPLRLLEAGEPHPVEDPRRLGELDVAIVDDLPVVAPRVEEVVVREHLRARGPRTLERLLAAVDDEADVAGAVRGLRPAGGQRDELVTE